MLVGPGWELLDQNLYCFDYPKRHKYSYTVVELSGCAESNLPIPAPLFAID